MSKDTGYQDGKLIFPETIFNFLKNEDNMKFGKLAVIGNPPYQIQTEAQQAREGGKQQGKQQAKPIYNLFIESIIDNLNPSYMVSINPSRWMTGGMGLDKFRERMMNDTRIKKIVHFSGECEVFPTVSIKGGVNYFLWQNDYNGKCEFVNGNTSNKRFLNTHDIILQDNNAFGILEKISHKSSHYISDMVFGIGVFGLNTNFDNWSGSGVKCYKIGNEVKYVKLTDMTDNHNIIGKWKVCTSKAGNVTPDKNGTVSIITTIFIVEPNSVSTNTYIVVNVFDSKNEAENFISYMKTKLFRFMLRLRASTHDINKKKFSWVPDVEDYSAPWTDAELYKKFNLSRQEVAYIESKIKTIK
jgi:site-specific DNA-methyltransferase (adenine-specific)